MTFLLDTHILLWWLSDDDNLSAQARGIIENSTHVFFVSAVTAWEISIKRVIGKLKAPQALADALNENHFQPLPITVAHALLAGELPPHHQDPFDRMLVAQSQLEGLTLLTHDRRLTRYGHFVKLI